MVAFVFAHPLRLEPATIAMFGAALLLLITNIGVKAEAQSETVHRRFGEVEWVTIFFFVGLFIVVHGIEHAGVLAILAGWVLDATGGDLAVTALAIMWISAVASAVVDNIPFVATMIPLIKSMAPSFGGPEGLMPLWWSLALGACLGGERLAGGRQREPDRGRHGGAGRTPDPLPAVHGARVPDDADEHRYRECLRLLPVSLRSARSPRANGGNHAFGRRSRRDPGGAVRHAGARRVPGMPVGARAVPPLPRRIGRHHRSRHAEVHCEPLDRSRVRGAARAGARRSALDVRRDGAPPPRCLRPSRRRLRAGAARIDPVEHAAHEGARDHGALRHELPVRHRRRHVPGDAHHPGHRRVDGALRPRRFERGPHRRAASPGRITWGGCAPPAAGASLSARGSRR